MTQRARILIARLLVVVIMIASVGNVLLVECRADDHHAVELIGHAGAASACSAEGSAQLCCGEDHHPEDCDDQAMFDPVTPQRCEQAWAMASTTAPLLAILAPLPCWWPPVASDPRSEPQRCPRPPPDLPRAANAFVALRLLI